MFEITGFDTAGVVNLKRESLAAALKKARELIADGCRDVQIVDPRGRVYTSFEEQAAYASPPSPQSSPTQRMGAGLSAIDWQRDGPCRSQAQHCSASRCACAASRRRAG